MNCFTLRGGLQFIKVTYEMQLLSLVCVAVAVSMMKIFNLMSVRLLYRKTSVSSASSGSVSCYKK